MSDTGSNTYRATVRSTVFAATAAQAAATFGMRRLRLPRGASTRERARWMHDTARLMLRRMAIDVTADGDPPLAGLLVSNHLSYLDVLVYASLLPCVFVAKREIEGWPMLGRLTQMAGTIFVDRTRRARNTAALARMREALDQGVPVVLFPEGTSTEGSRVLPFHPSLFAPTTRARAPVTAAAVGYASAAAAEREIAYHGDDVFIPHLFRTLGEAWITASVRFGEPAVFADRKTAALASHASVTALRAELSRPHAAERYRAPLAG